MKTSFVSTLAVTEALRQSLVKLQSDLVVAQKEVATGRLADVGLGLGGRTGQTVSLRQEHIRLHTIIDTNGLTASRLDTTQEALTGLRETADEFLKSLLSVRNGDAGPQVVQPQAENNLQALVANLNAALNGQYLFAGINADVKPLTDYYATPTAPNRRAVADAFLANFGVAQSDPAVGSISGADMRSFLDTQFTALFDDPSWNADWSAASDQNVRSRISSAELIDTSVNANEPAMRKLAMAYTMMADLGAEGLNEQAFQAVVDKAAEMVGSAVQELTTLQARVGTSQGRVEQANARMSLQIDILSTRIAGLENVDPYEATTRITTIMTQLETAYALTARMQDLGLLKYL